MASACAIEPVTQETGRIGRAGPELDAVTGAGSGAPPGPSYALLRALGRTAGTLVRVTTTRDIRTSTAYAACDVCGRTLLRGERAETYLQGGERRSVCELCKARALHEGWVREGTVPAYRDGDTRSERRRSLFGRLRARRAGSAQGRRRAPEEDLEAPPADEPEPGPSPEPASESGVELDELSPEPAEPALRRPMPTLRDREPAREPRHVRAVPTSPEQKTASAVHLFNDSEHPRTVAGVARSLGLPVVSVRPSDARPSLVNVVVSWELCWYRYEVDLSDEVPSVRVAGQGYELEELEPEELQPNAAADDTGSLTFG